MEMLLDGNKYDSLLIFTVTGFLWRRFLLRGFLSRGFLSRMFLSRKLQLLSQRFFNFFQDVFDCFWEDFDLFREDFGLLFYSDCNVAWPLWSSCSHGNPWLFIFMKVTNLSLITLRYRAAWKIIIISEQTFHKSVTPLAWLFWLQKCSSRLQKSVGAEGV